MQAGNLYLISWSAGTLARDAKNCGAPCGKRLCKPRWDAATANVSVLYEIAYAVPVPERKGWIRLNRTHFELIEEAMAEDQGITDGSEPTCFFRVVARRPKGKKAAIAERVARDESAKRGIPMTKRLAKACWDEFRKLQQVVRLDYL